MACAPFDRGATQTREPFPRKPSGRRFFFRLSSLAPSLQPAERMLGLRRLDRQKKTSPQDPLQFSDRLLPRTGRENSRVKDLIDLVLLIERIQLDADRLPTAIRETFQRRKAHEIPRVLLPPPGSLAGPFSEMATDCGLDPDMEKHLGVVAQFFQTLSF